MRGKRNDELYLELKPYLAFVYNFLTALVDHTAMASTRIKLCMKNYYFMRINTLHLTISKS